MKQLAWILLLVLGTTASVASACDSKSTPEEAAVVEAGSMDYSFKNEAREDEGCCDPAAPDCCARPCCQAASLADAFVLTPETRTTFRESPLLPGLPSHHRAPPKRPPIA